MQKIDENINLTEIQTQIGTIRANLKTSTYLKSFSKGFFIGTAIATPIVYKTMYSDASMIQNGTMLLLSATTYVASTIKIKKLNNKLFGLEKNNIVK